MKILTRNFFHILRRAVLLFFVINWSAATASPLTKPPAPKELDSSKYPITIITDSTMARVPFEFRQSALFHPWTYEIIDSVAQVLLRNPKINLSIEGYAHVEEGTDSICKWLSEDRAKFVKEYIMGRGVDSSRIISVIAYSNTKPLYKGKDKRGNELNCRVEMRLRYPVPPAPIKLLDSDEDGLTDNIDVCPNKFGYQDNHGCPDSNAVLVPFEQFQAGLIGPAYAVLDSVIGVLRQNPSFTISIQGHAYKAEGINSVCNGLAKERAEVVMLYLKSRSVSEARVETVRSYGNTRPLNAGKNPQETFLNSRASIFFNKH